MKTLYLHIGTPKTGTTAIQFYLCTNIRQFAKQGYVFPLWPGRIEGIGAHRNAHWLCAHGKTESGERSKDLQVQYIEKGLSRLEKSFSTYDNVIISDEGIYRTILNKANRFRWDMLMEHAAAHGYQVKIIIYLRRQDEYITSLYKQKVKEGAKGYNCSFDDFFEKRKSTKPNYAKQLDFLADIVGKENIIVRRYDRSRFVGGDVVTDFLGVVGVQKTDEFKEPKRAKNPSTNENISELSRYTMGMDLAESTRLAISAAALRSTKAADTSFRPSLLGKERTQQLLDECAQGNARVAQEYIGDGEPLFSEEISDAPMWSADNPYMLQDEVRFLVSIIDELNGRVSKLERLKKRGITDFVRRKFGGK